MTYTVKYDLTLDVAILLAEEFFYKVIVRRWLWILIGLIACTIVSYISYRNTGQYFILAFFTGVIASFFFGFYIIYKQNINRTRILIEVKDNPSREVIISDDNITFKSKMGYQHINWSEFYRYIESENMLFLISASKPIGLPKIFFNEDQQHFIRTKVSEAVISYRNTNHQKK